MRRLEDEKINSFVGGEGGMDGGCLADDGRKLSRRSLRYEHQNQA